jgi:uncharacterized phage-associated protein
MAKVHDVSAYIISKLRSVDAMKLQKLIYYSQAWSLVWDGRAMFTPKIEAWANGPVVPMVFKAYQGKFKVSTAVLGDKTALKPDERDTVDAVLKFYGDKDGFYLSELTHRERPWMDARRGLAPGEKSNNEITIAAMRDYYGGLV